MTSTYKWEESKHEPLDGAYEEAPQYLIVTINESIETLIKEAKDFLAGRPMSMNVIINHIPVEVDPEYSGRIRKGSLIIGSGEINAIRFETWNEYNDGSETFEFLLNEETLVPELSRLEIA